MPELGARKETGMKRMKRPSGDRQTLLPPEQPGKIVGLGDTANVAVLLQTLALWKIP